jgi:hypothetical protein
LHWEAEHGNPQESPSHYAHHEIIVGFLIEFPNLEAQRFTRWSQHLFGYRRPDISALSIPPPQQDGNHQGSKANQHRKDNQRVLLHPAIEPNTDQVVKLRGLYAVVDRSLFWQKDQDPFQIEEASFGENRDEAATTKRGPPLRQERAGGEWNLTVQWHGVSKHSVQVTARDEAGGVRK